jgi:allantoin racemase
MHLVYINPNATQTMTDSIVTSAQAAVPGAQISGLTNTDGPAAIQGPLDGDASIPGLLKCVEQAQDMGADAIVIACFDDTGLAQVRAVSACPVLGIGEASYTVASMAGGRFSVVTSLQISVPVIERNIVQSGFGAQCKGIHASDLEVLEIDGGTEDVRAKLASAILSAHSADESRAVILGCAGMTALAKDLAERTHVLLVDGVVSSAHLARAAVWSLNAP